MPDVNLSSEYIGNSFRTQNITQKTKINYGWMANSRLLSIIDATPSSCSCARRPASVSARFKAARASCVSSRDIGASIVEEESAEPPGVNGSSITPTIDDADAAAADEEVRDIGIVAAADVDAAIAAVDVVVEEEGAGPPAPAEEFADARKEAMADPAGRLQRPQTLRSTSTVRAAT